MLADLEECRFQAFVGQRLENGRRVARPRPVVEGQNDCLAAQEVVLLEMLETEAGTAGVSISTMRARLMPPGLSHGGIDVAPAGLLCAEAAGAGVLSAAAGGVVGAADGETPPGRIAEILGGFRPHCCSGGRYPQSCRFFNRSAAVSRTFSVDREAALAACSQAYYGHGKLEVLPKFNVKSLDDIATLYTPGVAYSVQEIIANREALHELSIKDNTIGVVTDGTAVLGLGRAGPYAAVPVMEGKAAMFKLLAGIDAIPLCVSVQKSLELVDILAALEPTFGGYNIEDVAAPGCFELMRELEARLTVPAIHDDQYGTATVIAAAIMNACKVTNREPRALCVVINGAGAAGTATFDLLSGMDFANDAWWSVGSRKRGSRP